MATSDLFPSVAARVPRRLGELALDAPFVVASRLTPDSLPQVGAGRTLGEAVAAHDESVGPKMPGRWTCATPLAIVQDHPGLSTTLRDDELVVSHGIPLGWVGAWGRIAAATLAGWSTDGLDDTLQSELLVDALGSTYLRAFFGATISRDLPAATRDIVLAEARDLAVRAVGEPADV